MSWRSCLVAQFLQARSHRPATQMNCASFTLETSVPINLLSGANMHVVMSRLQSAQVIEILSSHQKY